MTPAPEKAAPIPAEERLWWFLFVLNACGDHGSYANDDPGEWVAAFCDDVEPTDTFNRACDLKLATCTHNSMDETSRIWITEAGKRFLADRASQENRIREITAKIAEKKGWDGLECACGGGWKVGHLAGCPEAEARAALTGAAQEGGR